MRSPGVALVGAVVLMAIAGLMGTSVLLATSIEITISGNYRRAVEAFYLAEAVGEEARARLRGFSGGAPGFIGDSGFEYDPLWSAYILTSSDWRPTDDPSYSPSLTNYIPTQSAQTNTAIVANSLQTDLSYWVKIRHKSEYEAERNGHGTDSPHYVDRDGSLEHHTDDNPGNIVFYGYPAGDSIRPMEFTTAGATEAFPVEVVTAYGSLVGGSSVIELQVVRQPGPRVLAALYARNGVSLNESSVTISGVDHCGDVPSKPPVYTLAPSGTKGSATFRESPPTPVQGSLDIDLPLIVGSLIKGAAVISSDQFGVTLGSSSKPMTFYVKAATPPFAGVFTLQNATGFGILLVEGPARIRGPVTWHGLVVNAGTLTLDGSTGPISILGGVWSDQVQHVGGDISITYDSCAIKTSVLSRPLIVMNWRQIL